MGIFSRAKKPPQVQQLEAEAEAGPGAISQDYDQTVSAADLEREKVMNGASNHSPSNSSDAVVADAKPSEPPMGKEKERSTVRNALLIIALCV